MGSSDRGVRVAGTPKNPKVGIGGSGAKKSDIGCGPEIAFVGRRLRM
jgi:hypothetical protein